MPLMPYSSVDLPNSFDCLPRFRRTPQTFVMSGNAPTVPLPAAMIEECRQRKWNPHMYIGFQDDGSDACVKNFIYSATMQQVRLGAISDIHECMDSHSSTCQTGGWLGLWQYYQPTKYAPGINLQCVTTVHLSFTGTGFNMRNLCTALADQARFYDFTFNYFKLRMSRGADYHNQYGDLTYREPQIDIEAEIVWPYWL